jgi:hypothetical protein
MSVKKGQRLKTTEQQILHNVKKTDSGCWVRTSSLMPKGYSTIKLNGKTRYAHRISYEHFVGPIPDGMCICHSCDNPSCVNPQHLFLGTQKDNLADMTNKGRRNGPRGRNHPRATITGQIAAKIKEYRQLGYTYREIAAICGTTLKVVQDVSTGRTWKEVRPISV